MERLLHLRNEIDMPVDVEDALYCSRQSYPKRDDAITSRVDLVARNEDAMETRQGTRRKTLLELGWELERLVADKRLGESSTPSAVPREDESTTKARGEYAATLLQDNAEARMPIGNLNGEADAHQSPVVSLLLAVASKKDASAVSTGRAEIDPSAPGDKLQDGTSSSASAMSALQPLLRA